MGGMQMTFLDDSTILFGDNSAMHGALDARDGLSHGWIPIRRFQI